MLASFGFVIKKILNYGHCTKQMSSSEEGEPKEEEHGEPEEEHGESGEEQESQEQESEEEQEKEESQPTLRSATFPSVLCRSTGSPGV